MSNKTLDNRLYNIRIGYIMVGATAGLVVAGLAPALIFGYSLYSALVALNWSPAVAAVAGGSLAVTMEVVGGVSAHVAQHSDNPKVRNLALTALGVYTLIGVIYMAVFESNATIKRTGIMAYICAPLLYLSVSLLSATLQAKAQQTLIDQDAKQKEDQERARQQRQEDQDRAWQQQQAALAAEREHREHLAKIEADAAVRAERARAKAAAPRQVTTTSNDEIATTFTTDWRQVPDDLQRRFHKMTPEKIQETFGDLDARKIRDWRRYSRDLVANGHKNGVAK